MNEEIYRAAMDATKYNGDNAQIDAERLAKIMKVQGREDLHQTWLEIARAIAEIQGQKMQ